MTTFPKPISFPSIARPVNPTGIWGWLTTIDHKRIGILYGVTAFILFLSGGIEATLMRLQLAGPELDCQCRSVQPVVYNAWHNNDILGYHAYGGCIF